MIMLVSYIQFYLALAEIQQNQGVLYDSEAVDACLKVFTEDGFEFKMD